MPWLTRGDCHIELLAMVYIKIADLAVRIKKNPPSLWVLGTFCGRLCFGKVDVVMPTQYSQTGKISPRHLLMPLDRHRTTISWAKLVSKKCQSDKPHQNPLVTRLSAACNPNFWPKNSL
jgi:hypothetical protein